jgi:hypothetical protein
MVLEKRRVLPGHADLLVNDWVSQIFDEERMFLFSEMRRRPFQNEDSQLGFLRDEDPQPEMSSQEGKRPIPLCKNTVSTKTM